MISEVLTVVSVENIFFLYLTVRMPVRHFRKVRRKLRLPSSEKDSNSQMKVEIFLIVGYSVPNCRASNYG